MRYCPLRSPMFFRHCFVHALLLAWRFTLVLGVDANNLGRCQKSGCRTSPEADHLRGRGPAPRQILAPVVEWAVVFSLAWACSYLIRRSSHCLPWRRQATETKMAGSFTDACVGLLRRASAGRTPQKAASRRRPDAAFTFGSSASLGSLRDVIGSDDESGCDVSASTTHSCSSQSTCASDYTHSDSEAMSACTEFSSESNTASWSTARATGGKRGPKEDVRSNQSVSSATSTHALASAHRKKAEKSRPPEEAYYDSSYDESDGSSGYDIRDSYRTEYVSAVLITSRMLEHLTETSTHASMAGTASREDRGSRRALSDGNGPGRASGRPSRDGGRGRHAAEYIQFRCAAFSETPGWGSEKKLPVIREQNH